MLKALRLLWIAESDEDGASLEQAVAAQTVAFDRQRARPSECASLFDQSWDVFVCSLSEHTVLPEALFAHATGSSERRPVVLITDRFDAAASASYELGARVCERPHLLQQLVAALQSVVAESQACGERRRAQAFEHGQRDVLEQIAAGAPLNELLAAIVKLVEQQADGMLCSLLVLDRERLTLQHGASASLPNAFVRAIDGTAIGSSAGSCGRAAYLGEVVIVDDIATHPYWDDYRVHALPHGLRACWSSPIFSPEHTVLGTFAMYYRTPRKPTTREVGWVDRATHLAAIALVRDRAERALRQSQRLESLSTLAGGIAHDFNNILTAVTGNVNLVGGDLPAEHSGHESLGEIERACSRASDLVNQILMFSRHHESKRRAVRVEPVVEEALQQLRAALPSAIRVSARYTASLPEIFADPDQVKRVVLNLGRNAAQAMPVAGGVLSLVAERVEANDRLPAGATELKPGAYVRLDLADTGTGMATSTLERIFDPFFTTKEPGQGIGLGLSVVHGIVKSHDGAIVVRSAPEQGSCFSVYLPAVSPPQEKVAPISRPVPTRGEGERVLCIDDEEPVVRVTSQMLRRLGFRVVSQTDPSLALLAFEADPSQFDIVLTDFAMPQITCFDLVRSLRRARPTLPIVVTSGRIEADEIATLRGLGIAEVLFKPSTIAELTAALRRAIRASR